MVSFFFNSFIVQQNIFHSKLMLNKYKVSTMVNIFFKTIQIEKTDLKYLDSSIVFFLLNNNFYFFSFSNIFFKFNTFFFFINKLNFFFFTLFFFKNFRFLKNFFFWIRLVNIRITILDINLNRIILKTLVNLHIIFFMLKWFMYITNELLLFVFNLFIICKKIQILNFLQNISLVKSNL